MATDNEETAQLSPERMQLVLWEGRALAHLSGVASGQPGTTFEQAWAEFVAENPMPAPDLADFDADRHLLQVRARASESFEEARAEG